MGWFSGMGDAPPPLKDGPGFCAVQCFVLLAAKRAAVETFNSFIDHSGNRHNDLSVLGRPSFE